jgi:hypothetical protein
MDYDTDIILGYLEGELSEERRRRLEAQLQEDAHLAQLVSRLAADRRALRELEVEPAPRELAEEAIGRLERQALLGEPEELTVPTPRSRRRRAWVGRAAGLAAAATVVLAAGLVIVETLTQAPLLWEAGQWQTADGDGKGPTVASRETPGEGAAGSSAAIDEPQPDAGEESAEDTVGDVVEGDQAMPTLARERADQPEGNAPEAMSPAQKAEREAENNGASSTATPVPPSASSGLEPMGPTASLEEQLARAELPDSPKPYQSQPEPRKTATPLSASSESRATGSGDGRQLARHLDPMAPGWSVMKGQAAGSGLPQSAAAEVAKAPGAQGEMGWHVLAEPGPLYRRLASLAEPLRMLPPPDAPLAEAGGAPSAGLRLEPAVPAPVHWTLAFSRQERLAIWGHLAAQAEASQPAPPAIPEPNVDPTTLPRWTLLPVTVHPPMDTAANR